MVLPLIWPASVVQGVADNVLIYHWVVVGEVKCIDIADRSKKNVSTRCIVEGCFNASH